MSWLWKHDELCPHSYPVCDEVVAPGVGDDVHRVKNDYTAEADYTCGEQVSKEPKEDTNENKDIKPIKRAQTYSF